MESRLTSNGPTASCLFPLQQIKTLGLPKINTESSVAKNSKVYAPDISGIK